MPYLFKPVAWDELNDLARVHVLSWQQTYAGLVPQDYLDNLSISAREESWRRVFRSHQESAVQIAYHDYDAIGFISFGKARDKDKEGQGEIYAVYVLKENWGEGIGYMLFKIAKDGFLRQGITSAYLWSLEGNQRALQAYKRWGGVADYSRTKDEEIGGQVLKDVMVNFNFVAGKPPLR